MHPLDELIVLDHHKTAMEELQPLLDDPESGITGVFDMGRSGAALAWQYLANKKPLPELLQYVEDRDLWRFAFGNTTRDVCQGA